jgi:hypothetical protein
MMRAEHHPTFRHIGNKTSSTRGLFQRACIPRRRCASKEPLRLPTIDVNKYKRYPPLMMWIKRACATHRWWCESNEHALPTVDVNQTSMRYPPLMMWIKGACATYPPLMWIKGALLLTTTTDHWCESNKGYPPSMWTSTEPPRTYYLIHITGGNAPPPVPPTPAKKCNQQMTACSN